MISGKRNQTYIKKSGVMVFTLSRLNDAAYPSECVQVFIPYTKSELMRRRFGNLNKGNVVVMNKSNLTTNANNIQR